MFGRACSEGECYFTVVPFSIDDKGGEKLWIRGSYYQGDPECCHHVDRGSLSVVINDKGGDCCLSCH